jgi:hypothetical protein
MRFLIFFALLAFCAYAEPINAIAAVAEGEPITLYEVSEFAKAEKISKAAALQRLIDIRLREAKIKEFGLEVGEDEIDSRIDLVARRNNLDRATLRDLLVRRGADYSLYREEIKEAILNEKLAAYILAGGQIPVSEEEIERFYAANRDRFSQPSEIVVIQYASKDEKALRAIAQNPMLVDPAVTTTTQTLKARELNARLLATLAQTPIGRFTPVFPAADRMVTLLVREKRGSMPQPLESVKAEISEEIRANYEEKSIDDYFTKTRAKAQIAILREPR